MQTTSHIWEVGLCFFLKKVYFRIEEKKLLQIIDSWKKSIICNNLPSSGATNGLPKSELAGIFRKPTHGKNLDFYRPKVKKMSLIYVRKKFGRIIFKILSLEKNNYSPPAPPPPDPPNNLCHHSAPIETQAVYKRP